jgi:hypothetical protein
MNQEVYPRSINLKCKLDIPLEMKDNAESIENTQAWNDYRTKVKNKFKEKILNQGERVSTWMQETRYANFIKSIVALALGYATYH